MTDDKPLLALPRKIAPHELIEAYGTPAPADFARAIVADGRAQSVDDVRMMPPAPPHLSMPSIWARPTPDALVWIVAGLHPDEAGEAAR